MAKSRRVKCPVCGQWFYREDEPNYMMQDGRYYHNQCFQDKCKKEEARNNIHNYCKKLFGTGYSKRKIDSQIKELTDEGKTLENIYLALVYQYEHNGGDVSKAYNGIRIVGYIYNEAIQYYKRQFEIEQRQLAYLQTKPQEEPEETYHIRPTPITKPIGVNLFNLD